MPYERVSNGMFVEYIYIGLLSYYSGLLRHLSKQINYILFIMLLTAISCKQIECSALYDKM